MCFWWGKSWFYSGIYFLFWVGLIIGLVFFIKWLVKQGKSSPPSSEENAMDILKKRYARGEISKEEFEQIKKDIMA